MLGSRWLALLLAAVVGLSHAEDVVSNLCLGSQVGAQPCSDNGEYDGTWDASDPLGDDGVHAFEEGEASVMRVDLLQTKLNLKRGPSREIAEVEEPRVELAAGQSAEQTAVNETTDANLAQASSAHEHVLATAAVVSAKKGETARVPEQDILDHLPLLALVTKQTASEAKTKMYSFREFFLVALCLSMAAFALLAVHLKSQRPVILKHQAVDSLVATPAMGRSSLQQALYGKRAAGSERTGIWDFRSEGVRPPLATASLKGWGGAGDRGESGLAGQPSLQPSAKQVPENSGPWAIPPISLENAAPQQHEPLLIMPYDCVREGASSFDIVAASGEPVLHVALRGAADSRLLEVSRVPARGKALASVRVESSSSQGTSFVLSSGGGSSTSAADSIWGTLQPSPDGDQGGAVLIGHTGKVIARVPGASAEGHLRLLTSSGETVASSLVASAGAVVAGSRQMEVCVRQGIDPILVLCCFVSPLVLCPPHCSQQAPSDDPTDLGWSQTSD